MNLESFMLSEISQTEKHKYSVITFLDMEPKKKKIIRQANVCNKQTKMYRLIQKTNQKIPVRRGKERGARLGYEVKSYKLLCIK